MKKGRGRRRGQRWISEIPEKKWFAPDGASPGEVDTVDLNFEELEAVRLVDLLELRQEEAAFYMGISRKAFWNDLRSARKKIATALVYGLGIKIGGGSYLLRYETSGPRESEVQSPPLSREDELLVLEREVLLIEKRLGHLISRIETLKKRD